MRPSLGSLRTIKLPNRSGQTSLAAVALTFALAACLTPTANASSPETRKVQLSEARDKTILKLAELNDQLSDQMVQIQEIQTRLDWANISKNTTLQRLRTAVQVAYSGSREASPGQALSQYLFAIAQGRSSAGEVDLTYAATQEARELVGYQQSLNAVAEQKGKLDEAIALTEQTQSRIKFYKGLLESDLSATQAEITAAATRASGTKAASAQSSVDAQELQRVQTYRSNTALKSSFTTTAQRDFMGQYGFGPADGYPSGLSPTGQVFSGIASWYGPGFDGNLTASGAIYDQEGWTCAHKTLPLGTVLRVSRAGRSVVLLVNDRGPYIAGRVIDLSHAAASYLGIDGIGEISAEILSVS